MGIGRVAVVGGGPAGLAAAEVIAAAGLSVDLFDRMPTVGRKFLLAGKSGLNLTHSEDLETFLARYPAAPPALVAAVRAFPPEALRAWAAGLGVETMVGSSGRVFPTGMKASPLLRAWLRRLGAAGVRLNPRHRWIGVETGPTLVFETAEGERRVAADAVVLALGGASWPALGSDAGWVPILAGEGVAVTPLAPSNCGFDVAWSDHFRDRFAGEPVKTVVATAGARTLPGEFVVTRHGIEGSLVYALSAALRADLAAGRPAVLHLDLTPGRDAARLQRDLVRPRGSASFSTYLRKATGLEGVKAGLVRERLDDATRADPVRLAAALKALPVAVVAPRPIAEAISTAGGVAFAGLDAGFMLSAHPGIFVAGEMLDWDAPTGGYLLTAVIASGRAAGSGVLAWLGRRTDAR